jgi:hypothetical protein
MIGGMPSKAFSAVTLGRTILPDQDRGLSTWSMSALAHFADSSRTSPEVREVPQLAVSNRSKEASVVDHLVNEREQWRRHLQASVLAGTGNEHLLLFLRDRCRAARPHAGDLEDYLTILRPRRGVLGGSE